MANVDLKTKLADLDVDRLLKWLALIVAVATTMIVTVFASYYITFNGVLTAKQDYWGQFGDFIGGTLNPILSFLTLMAIVLTVVLQHKQLEMSRAELDISRMELEATREELRRSAAAQEKSELALSKQAIAMEISARISAVNHLLAQAEATISRINSYAAGSNEEALRNNAIKSRTQLLIDLKQLYERLKETDGESYPAAPGDARQAELAR